MSARSYGRHSFLESFLESLPNTTRKILQKRLCAARKNCELPSPGKDQLRVCSVVRPACLVVTRACEHWVCEHGVCEHEVCGHRFPEYMACLFRVCEHRVCEHRACVLRDCDDRVSEHRASVHRF